MTFVRVLMAVLLVCELWLEWTYLSDGQLEQAKRMFVVIVGALGANLYFALTDRRPA